MVLGSKGSLYTRWFQVVVYFYPANPENDAISTVDSNKLGDCVSVFLFMIV